MHYLKCIALLDFLQKKLCKGQRQQVPISVANEVQTAVIGVQALMEKENNPEVSNRLNDIMAGVVTIKSTSGLTYLTDSMKNALISGIDELSETIALLAFKYFQVNDFEPTEQIIPVMRNIVKVALTKGVL